MTEPTKRTIYKFSWQHDDFVIKVPMPAGSRLLTLDHLTFQRKIIYFEAPDDGESVDHEFWVIKDGAQVPAGYKFFTAYSRHGNVALIYVPDSLEVAH